MRYAAIFAVPRVTHENYRRAYQSFVSHNTERAMNTTNANVPIVARRPVLRWAVLVGGIAVGFATGLLTAKSFSFSANEPKAAFVAKPPQPAAVPAPTTSAIVPSPVIEANPQFFFGTGDGNGGYDSDRQAH
jgi:hypothetical protein